MTSAMSICTLPSACLIIRRMPDGLRDRQFPAGGLSLDALKQLSVDLSDFAGRKVRRVQLPDDLLQFHRHFVATRTPCILTGAIDHWPALRKWSSEYLRKTFATQLIHVAATPDGRADAVKAMPEGTAVFAQPAEGRLQMGDFLDHLRARERDAAGNVLYMQQQDDCLRKELAALAGDVDAEPEWAVRLFGGRPEAVNLWLGGSESVSSFHKDHYENLYAVVVGSKTFTLMPPSDVYRLAVRECPAAAYEAEGPDLRTARLRLAPRPGAVQWSSVDPTDPSRLAECPLFWDDSLPAPLQCTVREGEMLYLPSLWHHHVEQEAGAEGFCAAVNMWWDMQMDAAFACQAFISRLCGLPSGDVTSTSAADTTTVEE